MANLFRQNPLAMFLGIVAGVLVAVIVIEVVVSLFPKSATVESKPSAVSEAKMLPALAAVNPDQAYAQTAERPLFTPTRRQAPAAPAGSGSMVKGQFTLQGVIAVGDQRIALLKEKSSGKTHRVEKGKELNGMTLTTVEPDRVTLAQGGDEEVLTLQVQKSPAPSAAGAAPGAAAPGAAAPVQPTGLFAPHAPAGQPAAGMPQPVPAGATPPAQPAAASNPAQRSGFGPFPNQPVPDGAPATTPLTPEDLLARRRARRGPTTPNQ
jgi:hypothetical protein